MLMMADVGLWVVVELAVLEAAEMVDAIDGLGVFGMSIAGGTR